MNRPLHILLVDGDPETRAQAEHGLASMGALVTGCADEEHALDFCFAGTFDAVILDVDLLVSGGLHMTRRLREHVPYKSLPIIGVAKKAGTSIPLGSGLDLVVECPQDPRSLTQALHTLRQARGFLASSAPSQLTRYEP